jgi:DASS family divalent anion:Na+ symporter
MSILTAMAEKLSEYGLIQFYAAALQQKLAGTDWKAVLLIVSTIYYFARYLIPGNVLHACAMFHAFSQVLIVCGVPPLVGCMSLAIITSFCGFITPYATTSCPLFYNTGYVDIKLWWRVGFISMIVYLLIWFVFGGIWWKILGYW